jgi:hypothetical protein
VFVQQRGTSEVHILEVEVPLRDEQTMAVFPPSLHIAGSGQVHAGKFILSGGEIVLPSIVASRLLNFFIKATHLKNGL